MSRVSLLVLIFWSISIGCSNSERKTIPLDKMALIVADLDLADKMVRQYPIADRDSMSDLLEKSLLKVHNVSSEELEVNLYLYQSDYVEYEKLLKEISKIYDTKS